VLALSAEARAAGITRGMPVSRARKLCPDLILRPPNPRLYARASEALHTILRRYAPVIEPKGYGHAFLDLTGTGRLLGAAVDVAARIHRESHQQLGLPLAVGVAQNKLVSEAASEVAKTDGRTDGQTDRRTGEIPLLDVRPGYEASFLAPHEVGLLPDLDQEIRERLDDYQLELIGELQVIAEDDLALVFGRPGRLLAAQARGIDPRPVLPPAARAEFRVARTLGNDSNDLTLLHAVLRQLTERLGARLRARQLVARRLTLQLAYSDYATAKRSVPLPLAALDADLLQAAAQALSLALTRRVALRAIGVTLDRLLEADLQLELWGELSSRGPKARGIPPGPSRIQRDPSVPLASLGVPRDDTASPFARGGQSAERGTRNAERGTSLQTALDRIRTRYGSRGIRVGE
jgi:DNA polymerase-4